MAIQIPDHLLSRIRQHGEAAFPYECCGLLIGTMQGDLKIIHDLWQVENTWDQAEDNPMADGQTSERRFLIDPMDFKRGHDFAHTQGLGVVGTYHSHPNHPAVPSDFDRNHAFPWGFSCVIVSVQEGQAHDLVSWILDEHSQPQRETFDSQVPTSP